MTPGGRVCGGRDRHVGSPAAPEKPSGLVSDGGRKKFGAAHSSRSDRSGTCPQLHARNLEGHDGQGNNKKSPK